jgi:acetyltransferase
MGGENVAEGIDILNKAGIPTYETPERAISAFMYLYSHTRNLEMLQEIPEKLPINMQFELTTAKGIIENGLREKHRLLTEVESKDLLEAYGIPVNRTLVAESAHEAAQHAQQLGFPVAMKIHSRDITHKTDAHGVYLGLSNETDVKETFSKIMENGRAYNPEANLLGVTVQPMVKRPDYELILGSKRDPDFGPVILFGMGGIMTEILKDQAIGLPPMNRLLARRLMQSTRVFKLLKGYRNRPAARLDLIEEILIRLSQLVTDFPEIMELDINPLIIAENEILAVDARVIIEPSELSSPHHLVISSYPNQYEVTTTTKGGLEVFIRPIKPEDASLLEGLFANLSRQSIYYRFFSPIKSLSPKMLAYFTQIDYDRDMALVAIDRSQQEERMLGVARIMTKPGGNDPELAIAVGDPWHGKGVGAALMEQLLAIAKERKMASIGGIVLRENTHMIALARKLGFEISRDLDTNDYQVKISL